MDTKGALSCRIATGVATPRFLNRNCKTTDNGTRLALRWKGRQRDTPGCKGVQEPVMKTNHEPAQSEAVVLVHGLAANVVIMAPLARALGRHFAQVTNWGYRSLWYRIERHG